MSAMFLGSNRSKKSVVLDLKRPAAREALMALLAEADVFMHSMRPQKLAALGIDPETLTARFPRLVYAGLHGFAQGGSLRRPTGLRRRDPGHVGPGSVDGTAGRRSALPAHHRCRQDLRAGRRAGHPGRAVPARAHGARIFRGNPDVRDHGGFQLGRASVWPALRAAARPCRLSARAYALATAVAHVRRTYLHDAVHQPALAAFLCRGRGARHGNRPALRRHGAAHAAHRRTAGAGRWLRCPWHHRALARHLRTARDSGRTDPPPRRTARRPASGCDRLLRPTGGPAHGIGALSRRVREVRRPTPRRQHATAPRRTHAPVPRLRRPVAFLGGRVD